MPNFKHKLHKTRDRLTMHVCTIPFGQGAKGHGGGARGLSEATGCDLL